MIGGFSTVRHEVDNSSAVEFSGDELVLTLPNQRTEINDLIGKAPGWLLRSGITVLFFVVFVIIAFAALIKNPDKIAYTGVITSKNPPIALAPNLTSRIESIIAPTGSAVKEGDPIMYLKNTANKEDVRVVDELVNTIDVFDRRKIVSIQLPKYL